VPEREFLEAYQGGQVSRRTFIRRLVASGISLGAALTYADLLKAEPAWADHAPDDFYCPPGTVPDALVQVANFAYAPSVLTVLLGSCVQWHFNTTHSVRDSTGLLDSGFRPPFLGPGQESVDDYWRRFTAAGTFQYVCEHPPADHPLMVGEVSVPMAVSPRKAKAGKRFTILWATEHVPLGFVFDVQVNRPGDHRGWLDWREGTTLTSGRFRARDEGRYRFRSRVRRPSDGAASDWSPTARIKAL
jgi:plastocyanin